MGGERSPWWYSGEEPDAGGPESAGPESTGPESAGPESASPESAGPEPAAPADAAPVDWMGLLTGAARMVDWATTAVMAPHAEHADPADHPQCLVCRTILLVGDPSDLLRAPAEPEQGPAGAAEPVVADLPAARGTATVTWIPFDDEAVTGEA